MSATGPGLARLSQAPEVDYIKLSKEVLAFLKMKLKHLLDLGDSVGNDHRNLSRKINIFILFLLRIWRVFDCLLRKNYPIKLVSSKDIATSRNIK